METRIAVLLVAVLALAENSTGADGDYSPEVLFEYNKTNLAPDYIVFESYLRNINAKDEQDGQSGAVHFIQDTMALEHDEKGERMASDIYDILLSRYDLLAADIEAAENEMLCSGTRKEKTEDQVYDIIDRLPDVRARVAEKHYLETLATVDIETAQLLDTVIQRDKEEFSSTRFTARSMYGGPDIDVLKHVKKLCHKMAKKG